MKKKLITLSSLVLGFAPVAALAQVTASNGSCTSGGAYAQSLFSFLCIASNLLNKVVPVLVILGVVYFVWGVVQYVISDDEEAKSSGRNRIIAGIIGLAVIIGMWGLVRALTNTFLGGSNGINGGSIELPTVNY